MFRLIFPVLAALLFAAHLFFWGNYLWIGFVAILIVLLVIPFRPVAWIWQTSLIVFAAEWWFSAYELYVRRITYGQPFLLGVSILVGCGLFTALAAVVFNSAALKRRYALHTSK